MSFGCGASKAFIFLQKRGQLGDFFWSVQPEVGFFLGVFAEVIELAGRAAGLGLDGARRAEPARAEADDEFPAVLAHAERAVDGVVNHAFADGGFARVDADGFAGEQVQQVIGIPGRVVRQVIARCGREGRDEVD